MSNRIRTYKDLLQEKQRLELLLATQKQVVIDEFSELQTLAKEEIKPVRKAVAFANMFMTKDRSSLLLSFGADKLIDFVMKKLLLKKAGWIMRLVIPFFLKNYSSHLFSGKKNKFFKKLVSTFKKHSENGHQEEYSDQEKAFNN